jgi:LAO/AO transport system kinase
MRHRPQDPPGFPKALCVSAHTGAGLEAAWAEIAALDTARRAAGVRDARRREQALSWFAEAVERGLIARLRADPEAARRQEALARAVAAGEMAPDAAAEALLEGFAPMRAPDRG